MVCPVVAVPIMALEVLVFPFKETLEVLAFRLGMLGRVAVVELMLLALTGLLVLVAMVAMVWQAQSLVPRFLMPVAVAVVCILPERLVPVALAVAEQVARCLALGLQGQRTLAVVVAVGLLTLALVAQVAMVVPVS